MTSHQLVRRIAPGILIAAALSLAAGAVLADINGRTGRAQSPTGCNCHGSSSTPSVNVTITGPQSVNVNSTNSYTVTVTGGPATGLGGFNLRASAGSLTAGANTRVSGSDVTHTSENGRSWTFSWTAPAAIGTVNFWAVALAADGGGDEAGDSWDWYGGAVNTAFPIIVTDAAGVGESASTFWLAPPSPNPCANGARLSFSLPSPGEARLELLDTAGRSVRTLISGTVPAGPQFVIWDGRSASGARVPAGVYFARLSTMQRTLTTRVVVLEGAR